MSGPDEEIGFFEDEPATFASRRAPRRPSVPRRGGGPRRPASPPPGAVALARLVGLVALAIAVIVGFVFWVGSCQGQSKHDEYASYVQSIRPLADGSAQIGSQFANILASPTLTLAGLETQLESWSQQEQLAYAAAQRIRPPGPVQAAHEDVVAALQLRAIGLAGLANTLGQAGDTTSSAPVAASLAAQAQLLSASDIVWAQLFRLPATQTLARLGVTGVIVPASQFVTSPGIISSHSFALVYTRLHTGGGGSGGLHGSALVGTQAVAGSKTVTLSTTATRTVNVSSSLVIRVTLEDSGNYPEVRIPVKLTVAVGSKKVFTKSVAVRAIGPKQQAVVSISNLQLPPTAFGHSATITVAIGRVPGEKNLANNHATYPVLFSLAGG